MGLRAPKLQRRVAQMLSEPNPGGTPDLSDPEDIAKWMLDNKGYRTSEHFCDVIMAQTTDKETFSLWYSIRTWLRMMHNAGALR